MKRRQQRIRRIVLVAAAVLAALAPASAKEFDTVVETTYRQVTWEDFKGREFRGNRWEDGTWAHLTSAVVVEPTRIEPRQLGDGRWIAELAGLEVYGVMDKDLSGAAPGAKSEKLLAHEQLHFDVTEAFARRLTVKLQPLTGTGGDAKSAVSDLQEKLQRTYDQSVRELLAYQDRYDAETRHGTRRKAQEKWNETIAALFAAATAELEQARAAEAPP